MNCHKDTRSQMYSGNFGGGVQICLQLGFAKINKVQIVESVIPVNFCK
jgi:hypothetical protein